MQNGLAPNSVISNTQGTSWDEFLTGEYGFAENGSWFKSAADEAGYLSIQVPGIDGGAAPAPTGGEFIAIPVQKDAARYATSAKIVECLSAGSAGATALGYIAPTTDGVDAQLADDPTLEFWASAVADAKPRTADNLGTNYGIISEQLYTAVQNALSGAATPADALAEAQTAAAAKSPSNATERTRVHAARQDADTGRRGQERSASDKLVAWAFIAAGRRSTSSVFYAYPLARNVDLSLRDYTLRSFIDGTAEFVGPRQLRRGHPEQRRSRRRSPTPRSSRSSPSPSSSRSDSRSPSSSSASSRCRRRCARCSSCRGCCHCWSPRRCGRGCSTASPGSSTPCSSAVGIPQINWLTSPQWAIVSVLIANIWIGIPFNLVLLYSGLQNIPGEVYEAASLDGANGWQTFWRITFPLLRPVSAITILLGLVYTLKVFDIIWIMTQGRPGQLVDDVRDLVVPARLRRRHARPQSRRRRREPAHPGRARRSASSTSGCSGELANA